LTVITNNGYASEYRLVFLHNLCKTTLSQTKNSKAVKEKNSKTAEKRQQTFFLIQKCYKS